MEQDLLKAHYEPMFNALRDCCREEARKGKWSKEFDGPLALDLVTMFTTHGFEVEQYLPTPICCEACQKRKGMAIPVCDQHLDGIKAKISWMPKRDD
jgi:hypothetical protein